MVFQDGGGYVKRDGSWRVPVVFDNLIAKKEMPVTVAVFINPGEFPEKPDAKGGPGKNRSAEYDSLGGTYSKFLLEEILPEVGKTVKLTNDPEGRAIAGSSSGGICAFTVAWEHPESFRKVFSTIGSFTNIRGGNAYPDMVRKADKKPIRVFQQDGSNDLVNQFGSWPEANKAMAAALEEKGYDHKLVFGEGTHNPRHGASIMPDAMRWLWRGYEAK
jgi:enterochelin esterase family protein